ncbi:MAG: hypothetical protein WCF85_11615 [Rhodospirillaceae bacterium]
MDEDLIPEPQLAAEISKAIGKPCPHSYVALSNRRRSGKWPATKIGGRWFVRRGDLPAVLVALGMAGGNGGRRYRSRLAHFRISLLEYR